MGSVLKVRGLHTYYGELHALCGVSLHVGEGEIVSVIGNNGAGKTTTLMTVSGVLRPRKGEIEFDGRRIDALKPAEIVALGLGHVPEGRPLFSSMTVEENLLMGACSRRAKGTRTETMERVYALFPHLQERGRQIAGTLSGGEQQMVAIGRGLMALPRLLMLDEPSLGLSPVMVTAMFEAIHRINQGGTTILLVEQNVFRALKLSHRGYILEDGRIVAEGPSDDLLRNPQVRTTYLGL
ncbi:MAG TPA: ABC transporter ATP-binding protein [Candidatus Methylomirabilis sp.]